MNPNKDGELKDSEKNDSSLSEEEMEELIREYQESLAAVAEAKKRFNDRFEGKNEEEMAEELAKVYSEAEGAAQKDGIPIMHVGSDKEEKS